MSKRVTLKDIATHAGVSQSTVSVFLKGRTDVCSPETADRIRAAMSELNYTHRRSAATPPSPGSGEPGGHGGVALAAFAPAPYGYTANPLSPAFASPPPSRRSRNIGIAFSPEQDLLSPTEPSGSGTFRADAIWRGVAQAAEWEDYGLLAYPSRVRSSAGIETFLDGSAAGVILAANGPDPRAEPLATAGLPVLLLGWFQGIPDSCAAVYAYERDTVELALEHLWSLGHRRIAHLSGPVGDVSAERRDRYERWMRVHDAADPALVQTASTWGGADGAPARALELWESLPEPPTAVFCAGDALALQLIRAAEQRGRNVPGDLSVVGVGDTAGILAGQGDDGDPWADRLTTVALPNERIGQEAVRLLLRRIDGVPADSCRIAVPVTQLLVRGTTAAAPASRLP